MRPTRIGTRGSALARTQTNQTVEQLRRLHPDVSFEIVFIKTTGDVRSDVPFTSVGTKGMFVKEIEEALLAGDIDVAVHSMKDLPGELPAGLELAAVPARVDPRDALLSPGASLVELPMGARVGTSSLRRQAQLRARRPDLQIEELRGNLDTRIRKLDSGNYDAIVLACAGLERMGWAHRIIERLPVEVSIPAPGQGALALETRADDLQTRDLLTPIHDRDTADAVAAERGFQAALGAGCTVPAGALATLEDNGDLRIRAIVAAPDGKRVWRAELRGLRADARELGERAARELLDQGAREALGV